jgi:hypothetical protein
MNSNTFDGREMPLPGLTTTTGTAYWPYIGDYYQPAHPMTTGWITTIPAPPQECSGEVHIFPCPHCDKCKCGKATVSKR